MSEENREFGRLQFGTPEKWERIRREGPQNEEEARDVAAALAYMGSEDDRVPNAGAATIRVLLQELRGQGRQMEGGRVEVKSRQVLGQSPDGTVTEGWELVVHPDGASLIRIYPPDHHTVSRRPGSSGPDCEHCWHGTGTVFLTSPPKQREVCCACGNTRIKVHETTKTDPTKHGPFFPGKR